MAASWSSVTENISQILVGGAVRVLGVADGAFSDVSTGGDASLEYLEGRTLPGLAALAGQDGGEHAPPDAAESAIDEATMRGSR